MRRIWCSMPIEEARRQKRSPPGFRTRQVPRSMARNWSSPRAKWSTALLSTTSAKALGKDISSMASTRKLPGGSRGARHAARRRVFSTARGSESAPKTSYPSQKLVEQVDVDLCKLLKQVSHALVYVASGGEATAPPVSDYGYPRGMRIAALAVLAVAALGAQEVSPCHNTPAYADR